MENKKVNIGIVPIKVEAITLSKPKKSTSKPKKSLAQS